MKQISLIIVFLLSSILAISQGNITSQSKMMFIKNQGQIQDSDGNPKTEILFVADLNGMRAYFTNNSISYVIAKENTESDKYQTYRFDVEFVNANPDAQLIPNNELKLKYHFYNTSNQDGITNVRTFTKLRYKNIYPGIDIEFNTADNGLKYNFIVYPGADPSDIEMKYVGADLNLTAGGDLAINTPLGVLDESIPSTFQYIKGEKEKDKEGKIINKSEKREISCSYVVEGHIVKFKPQEYDNNYTLIIDPQLIWGTYLGGSNLEKVGYASPFQGNNPTGVVLANGSIAIDNFSGLKEVIVTGSTLSYDFPANIQVYQGNYDIFIFKMDSTGSTRLWGTFLGGDDDDFGTDVAIQSNGNVIGVGATESTTGYYVLPYNAIQDQLAGGFDGFITRLNGANGMRLNFTYYGGSQDDCIQGVELNMQDEIYVVGTTRSSTFATPGWYNTCTNCPVPDAFIAKFNSVIDTNYFLFYYGGDGNEVGLDIDITLTGEIAITGSTDDTTSFPFENPVDSVLNNGQQGAWTDAFVAMFFEANNVPDLVFSSLYGGEYGDIGMSIAAPNMHTLTLTGWSMSTNLPIIVPNVGQQYISDVTYGDAFLAQFNGDPNGPSLTWSTFLGGDSLDRANHIYYDRLTNTFQVAGFTDSPNFPLNSALQTLLNAGIPNYFDAFIARFSMDGNRLYSSYYGGAKDDMGIGIESVGYFTTLYGETIGTLQFPYDTVGYMPFEGSHSLVNPDADMGEYKGNGDAFIACFDNNKSILNTYLGDSDDENVKDIFIDENGFIYLTGYAEGEFLGTPGVLQETNSSGSQDAFITKFDPYGDGVWFTYLGSTNSMEDGGNGVAVDVDGNVYATGYFKGTYPGDYYVHQPDFAGDTDAFLIKLNPDGTKDWFTFFGDNGEGGNEYGEDVVVTLSGDVYIAGSAEENVDMTPNCYQSNNAGGVDAFVAKFDPQYGTVVWSTYYGGASGDDIAFDLITDGGEVAITGHTTSINDLPTTQNAFRATRRGAEDAFLAVLNFTGTSLVYGTYFGGDRIDKAHKIIKYNLDYIIAGSTNSRVDLAYLGYDVTYGSDPLDPYFDGFAAQLGTNGSRAWATYIGGSDVDEVYGLVDGWDGLYVSGHSNSGDSISTTGSYQELKNMGYDGFVVKLSYDGATKYWGSYIGGTEDDKMTVVGYSSVLGSPVLAGDTKSNPFPDISSNAYQTSYDGEWDGFIAAITADGTRLGKIAEYNDKIYTNLPTNNALNLYPNPSSDVLTIETMLDSKANVKITVTDLLGIPVFEFSENVPAGIYNLKLDISNFTPGMYNVFFQSDTSKLVKPFIKE